MTEPDGLRERMEGWLAEAKAQTQGGWKDLDEARQAANARVEDLTARMAEIANGTYTGAAGAEGDDERVVAEIDGNGRLLRLEISPYAMRDFDAKQLSTACTEAIAAARTQLTAEFEARMPEVAQPDAAGQGVPDPPDLDEIMRHAKELSWRR